MAGITFSEQEIKKLILALASSKTPMSEAQDEAQETPAHEASPKDPSEDSAEGETPDKPSDAASSDAKPDESTKAMLERKLKEK